MNVKSYLYNIMHTSPKKIIVKNFGKFSLECCKELNVKNVLNGKSQADK